ncbi:MAG TPA: hypothetical protein VHM90_22900, partial [Phycisphaerae bacterium]|nr:hypothetical protein [Phycisphaerae bacterium]
TSWNFRGAAAGVPTVVRAASADPNPVTDTRTHLDVLGGDASGEKKLTYTWSVVDMPSDAAVPSFSANATNGTKSIIAQFFEPGDYTFRCTITNLSGGSVSSDVAVSVIPTATTLRTSLHAQKALFGQTIQYRTLVLDQFNAPLRSQPKIAYSIESGEGSVDADTGLFTASNNVRGHVDIGVRGGGLSGTVGVTVTGP